jgi:hypothetical protein
LCERVRGARLRAAVLHCLLHRFSSLSLPPPVPTGHPRTAASRRERPAGRSGSSSRWLASTPPAKREALELYPEAAPEKSDASKKRRCALVQSGWADRGKIAGSQLPRGCLSRKLAGVIGNDEAPGLFTEGFYRYSIFSSSLDVSNHLLNLLSPLSGSSFASEIA